MTGQPLIEMEGTRLPSLALSPKMTTRESPKVCNAQHGDRWPRRTLVNSDMTLTRGTLKKVGLPLPELIDLPIHLVVTEIAIIYHPAHLELTTKHTLLESWLATGLWLPLAKLGNAELLNPYLLANQTVSCQTHYR